MRIWFDTEFIEDGKTIDLISIGAVREDGEEFYAENSECDLSRACPWVKENVLPHLAGGYCALDRNTIAEKFRAFVGDDPRFWAYFGAYDWVVLCQLYGRMVDLPKGWPMFCRDVMQLATDMGQLGFPPKPQIEHNALHDARWTRDAWKYLMLLRDDYAGFRVA